jgi:hypothetical protein
MAEIVCIECKSTVSDALAFCSECGFPFDSTLAEQQEIAVSSAAAVTGAADAKGAVADVAGAFADTVAADQDASHTATAIPLPEILQRSFEPLMVEMGELQRALADIKQNFDTHATISAEHTQKALTDIALKLDELARFNSIKEAEAQAITAKETKKGLLAAFYKTLNSPDSMFDYMFYISIVQIIFVVVNLFLVAYIVTLVR